MYSGLFTLIPLKYSVMSIVFRSYLICKYGRLVFPSQYKYRNMILDRIYESDTANKV